MIPTEFPSFISHALEAARDTLKRFGRLDRETLDGLSYARGPYLRFLDVDELDVVRREKPDLLRLDSTTERLCVDTTVDVHPQAATRKLERLVGTLENKGAPGSVIDGYRQELQVARLSQGEDYDWSSVRTYPKDAARFAGYEHDLACQRLTAMKLLERLRNWRREELRETSALLFSKGAYMSLRSVEGIDDPAGARHFMACAIDHLSQVNQRTDQDYLEEVAASAFAQEAHMSIESFWSMWLDQIWLGAWREVLHRVTFPNDL